MLQIANPRERAAVAAADAVLRLAVSVRTRRSRPPAGEVRRILVLRLERIGDLLMSLPALHALRERAPQAKIDLVVGSWNERLARLIPHVTTVRTLDAPWLAREGEGLQFGALVRRATEDWAPRNYDVAINFEGDVRSHFLMNRSRAPVRVGFDIGDLTLIAKRSGGGFPFQRVYETIDGTQELDAHGPRSMPIWGSDYAHQARDAYRDENYMRGRFDPELYTRTRILALTDYLNRIQAK